MIYTLLSFDVVEVWNTYFAYWKEYISEYVSILSGV